MNMSCNGSLISSLLYFKLHSDCCLDKKKKSSPNLSKINQQLKAKSPSEMKKLEFDEENKTSKLEYNEKNKTSNEYVDLTMIASQSSKGQGSHEIKGQEESRYQIDSDDNDGKSIESK